MRRPILQANSLPTSPKKSNCTTSTSFTSNKVEPYVVDFVSMADRRINDMAKEVSDLKEELYDSNQIIQTLKSKVFFTDIISLFPGLQKLLEYK